MTTPCNVCQGEGHVTVKMRDLGGFGCDGFPNLGIVACPACNGKGYVTQEDRERIQSVEIYNQIVP